MSQPTMTCPECGFQRVVKKSPDATDRWFKKYHPCKVKPEYRAGFSIVGRYEGQGGS